jgi:peptide/nickel transport system permease protein
MLDVMDEDYVRTAMRQGPAGAAGSPQARPAQLADPDHRSSGSISRGDRGGAILTETVFNLPGVGLYAGQSVASLDLPPLIAVTMFGAFFIELLNTVVDIVYAYLDPRIRLGTQAA